MTTVYQDFLSVMLVTTPLVALGITLLLAVDKTFNGCD